MIRGVNRKVIEINHPDSVYFERAVLYLRPEVAEVPIQEAQEESEYYFRHAPAIRKRRRLRSWLLFFLGAVSSAGVCLLAGWLIR